MEIIAQKNMRALDKCLVILVFIFECNPTLALFDTAQYLTLSFICLRLFFLKNIILYSYTQKYICFAVWCVFSLLWSISAESAFGNLVMVFKCLVIIIYFTNINFNLKYIITTYVIINVIDALILMPNIDLASILDRGARGHHIVMGVTWSINIICTMFAFSIFFLFLLYKHEKKIYLRCVYLVIAIPLICDIFILGSRQALILSLGSIALYYTIKCFQKPTTKNIIYILIVLFSTLAILIYVVNDPFLNQTLGKRLVRTYIDETSDNARINLIKEGYKFFLDSPLLGTGLGSYRMLIHNVQAYAHNNYIELLVSCGFIGFTFYHMMVICPVFNIQKNRKQLNIERNTIVYVLVIMILFSEMVIVTYQVFQYQLMIFVAFMVSKLNKE